MEIKDKENLTSEEVKGLSFEVIRLLDGLKYDTASFILDQARQRMFNTSRVVAESAVKDFVYKEAE